MDERLKRVASGADWLSRTRTLDDHMCPVWVEQMRPKCHYICRHNSGNLKPFTDCACCLFAYALLARSPRPSSRGGRRELLLRRAMRGIRATKDHAPGPGGGPCSWFLGGKSDSAGGGATEEGKATTSIFPYSVLCNRHESFAVRIRIMLVQRRPRCNAITLLSCTAPHTYTQDLGARVPP
jgi:hypothetical protein